MLIHNTKPLKTCVRTKMHNIKHLCSGSWKNINNRKFIFTINPLLIHILYFATLSTVGFAFLKSSKPRTELMPRNIDLFFTSASAATVSSMSTVDMEVFSDAHLVVITILMLVGGEIFTSMAGLHLRRFGKSNKVESVESMSTTSISHSLDLPIQESGSNPKIKYDSIRFLSYVVLVYFVGIQILGVASVLLYLNLVPSAENVLRNKGLKTATFAVFTVVSTFASCGFVPTNENMIVFRKNSGLLLVLIPHILLGNTLFPSALRLFIKFIGRKFKREEAKYLVHHSREVGYLHLLTGRHSALLPATVFGFILIGFVLLCSLEWDSAGLSELNGYQKVVGIIFECANARHSGETIVDLSAVAPTILVFFVVMMYLPPYTSYLPNNKWDEVKYEGIRKKRSYSCVAEKVVFSQLGYLVIFVLLICITERKSLKEDPLNFILLNILVEVISAYGNVGFTTGYSCDRQIKIDEKCVTKWYGFCGRWSDEGKIILIIVMFFGRLKKFNMNGGRAWKLL